MGSSVVPHGGFTTSGVHDGINSVANTKWLFCNYLMRTYALHRIVSSAHFRNYGIHLIAIKRTAVTNLSAGFGIKRRVVKNDLACLAGLQLLHALTIFDDGQHFAILRSRLQVSFKG